MAMVLATTIGSVLGFVLGLFLAFAAGLHEPVHVFLPAVAVGGLCGAILLWGASKVMPYLFGWRRTLAELALMAGAFGALALFVQIIG